jgi:pantoate--beta-alanine ligase
VSIFVNPLQFDRPEDLEAYPRTLAEDAALLEAEGVELLFIPGVAAIYPEGMEHHTRVEVPGLSEGLCGASRPGHFVGVATIVCKLFNLVQPDMALFGKKDYQQLLVIRKMVEDLAMPVEILGVETVREADGLAMSSRNNYLDADQRRRAPALYRALVATAERLRSGRRDYAVLEKQAMTELELAGLRGDYFSIRRTTDLGKPAKEEKKLVILAAAFLGSARLIDNLEVTLGP